MPLSPPSALNYSPYTCTLSLSANQSVASSSGPSYTTLLFDTIAVDSTIENAWEGLDPAQLGKIYLPAGAVWARGFLHVNFAYSATCIGLTVACEYNGGAFLPGADDSFAPNASSLGSKRGTRHMTNTGWFKTTGSGLEYIQAYVGQDSGGAGGAALNVTAGPFTWFQVEVLF